MGRQSLYKYYSETTWAQAFLDGEIFFRSLAYFRDYEDRNVREDKNEGSALYSPDAGLQITNHTQNKTFVMPGWSFSSTARQKDIFVFCLSQSLSKEIWTRFGAVVCVEVFDISEFCARVEAVLPPKATFPNPQGRPRIGHRVDYYKPTDAGNPRWAVPDKIATSKLIDYAWQDEFRLVFGIADAFEFQNVNTRLVHETHKEARNPDEHLSYLAKARSLRDICRIHS